MDNHEKESYIKAGKIAAQIKQYAREIVKPGMKLIDIANLIDKKIKDLGADYAFPVNLSLNDIAAHFTPTNDCEDVAEGIIKVDIGVAVDGYIADTAITLDLTKDKKYAEMIELNKQCLHAVMQKLDSSSHICDVGNTVSDILEGYNRKNKTNYSIITGLSGHQIAQNIIHAGLTVPNYKNANKTMLHHIAFAVEPFVTGGRGEIYEGPGGGIYALRGSERPRDPQARKILEFIKEHYKTRPFCERWLENAGLEKVKYCLTLLVKQGIIRHYPLLIEKSGGAVSQFENTFLNTGEELIITTFEEGWLEK